MNTILICKCCSQIYELCHAFKGPIPYLYALPLIYSLLLTTLLITLLQQQIAIKITGQTDTFETYLFFLVFCQYQVADMMKCRLGLELLTLVFALVTSFEVVVRVDGVKLYL
jgi:hypothetical protein